MVVDVGKDYDNSATITGRLALGANHFENNKIDRNHKKGSNWWLKPVEKKPCTWSATLATEKMVKAFNKAWDIVEQIPNTDSGYSATLFRHEDGLYTLAFRSTESKAK